MKIRDIVVIAVAVGMAFSAPVSAGVCAKAKKAVVTACDKAQDKVSDTGLSAKKTVTGKKTKTFVQGHYRQDGTHVDGHYRKLAKPQYQPSLVDKAQNKVADTGVKAVAKVTGKKTKTFVSGHHTSNGTHVKGHFRKLPSK